MAVASDAAEVSNFRWSYQYFCRKDSALNFTILTVLIVPKAFCSAYFNKSPTEVKLKKNKQELEITWNSGEVFSYPAELLRVESPSAEVRGHAPGEKKV